MLDAQYTRTPLFPFAVPQRRRRVFVVGCLGDWSRAAEVLLEPGCVSWNPPTRFKARERVAEDSRNRIETASTIRMRAGCNGGEKGALVGDNLSHTLLNGNDQTVVCCNSAEFGQRKMESVTSTLTTRENMVRGDTKLILSGKFWNGDDVAASVTCSSDDQRMPDKGNCQLVFTMDADRSNSMKSSNPQSGFHEADVSKTLDTTVPTPQKAQGGQMVIAYENNPTEYQKNQLEDISKYHAVCSALGLARDVLESGKNAKFGLTRIENTQPTLTARGAGGCLTHSTVRRLLPIECERLMGFPDNHTRIAWNGKPAEYCPDAPRYKACGNSMCVNVMHWIGKQIEHEINNPQPLKIYQPEQMEFDF